MAKSQAMSKKLAKHVQQVMPAFQTQNSLSEIEQVHRQLLAIEPELASELAEERAQQAADKAYIADIKRLVALKTSLDNDFKLCEQKHAELELQYNTTPETVVHNNQQSTKTPFGNWRFPDIASFTLSWTGMSVALVVGTANVYSNLQSAGIPIFIDQPWLAAFISALMPLGSLSIKYVSNLFVTYRNKKRYATTIYSASTTVILLWTVAFALNFTGVSADIDFDALGESDGKGVYLVWLQLTAEILIAASLALSADQIYQKYNPDTLVESQAFQRIRVLREQHKAEYEALRQQVIEVESDLAKVQADHAELKQSHILAYHALRARFNQLNSFY